MSEENKSINEKNSQKNIINSTIESNEIKTENEIANNTRRTTKRIKKRIVAIIVVTSIFVFFLLFSVIFALLNINNNKILKNVSIMGIDVGNMTIEEAKEKINKIIETKQSEELTLKNEEFETTLNLTQIDFKFDLESAINEAYNIEKNGNIIKNNYSILFTNLFGNRIECKYEYDEESLDKKIDNISSKMPNVVVENSYYIEDEQLIIVKGKEGLVIKKENLKNSIIEEMKNIEEKYNVITIPTETVQPGEINLEKIRNEIYKEPKDAYISKNPTTVHPHENGVDFAISIEEAKKIIEEDKNEYIIPLKITVPKKTVEDLGEEAFPDKLATFTTRYDPSNKNRANNVSISADKIDGTIIMPGETFSYNQTVGERTIAAGYKEAGAYSGGRVVQDVGGGICQTSSTLYNAVLLANLEIVDRTNHQFLTSYVEAGKDATVTWGGIDFKFKNSRSYPIKIEASAKNGVCEMSIYGIREETEYEVEIQSEVLSYLPYTTKYEEDSTLEEGKEVIDQSGYEGCTSETYRILKKNGKIISKTLLSKDTYDPMTRIVRKGTKLVEN